MPDTHPRSFPGRRTARLPLASLVALTLAACGDDGSGDLPDQRLEIAIHDDVRGTHVKVNGYRDRAPGRDWYDAVLTGNATWSTHERPNGCSILGADPSGRTLRCERPFDNSYHELASDEGEERFFHPLYIDTPADARIDVEVAFAEAERDRTPGDNRAAASVMHLEDPPPRFEIDAPPAVLGHDGRTTELTVEITQPANAFPRDARLAVSVPDHVTVTSAEVIGEAPYAASESAPVACDVDEAVVCPLPDFSPGLVYTATLRLMSVRASDEPLALAVVLDVLEPGIDPVRADVHVAHMASTDALQSLLDAAVDGDVVTLPPGTYGGSLRGTGRRFDVRGADGDEPTVLVADTDTALLQGIAPRSTWSNLVLQSFGAPVLFGYGANVTLADSVIEPAPGAPHRLVAGLAGFHQSGSYRLLGNTIRGWGASDGSDCERIVDLTQHGGSIYLQHNVFAGNSCDAVLGSELLAPVPVFGEYDNVDLRASNNTFVGSPVLIRLTGHADGPRALAFRNNIVAGADELLSLDIDPSDAPSRLSFTTSSNLSWDGEASNALADAAERGEIVVETADLRVDPLFVDARAADYRLSVLSPAIDAGSPPGEYRWSQAYHPCGRLSCDGPKEPEFGPDDYPQPGPDAVAPPIDGDGDGVAPHDIGAFEFRP